MNNPKRKVHVHLDYGRSLKTWEKKFGDGRVWEKYPYGYQHAVDRYDLSYSVDKSENAFTRLARLGVYWCLGFDMIHAWRNRTAITEADAVWTHTEHEHLAVALLLRISKNKKTKLVAQSVWLWDEWPSYSRVRKAIYHWLLARGNAHTTHSQLNRTLAKAVLPEAEVYFVPYGTENINIEGAVTKGPGTKLRVVAPGNDRDRDWATIVKAVRGADNVELRILSRKADAGLASGIPNVSVIRPQGTADLSDHYRWANVVAVPMRRNVHASGLTVTLEAINAGLPAVVTRVGGIDDYFGNYVTYVEPGDPEQLVEALWESIGSSSRPDRGRSYVEARGLTAVDFAARHVLITEKLFGAPVDVRKISEFNKVTAKPYG